MSFWAMLALSALFTIAARLLTSKPKDTNKPGQINPPTIESGQPIPVLWGRGRVPLVVVWFGAYDAKLVTKKVKSGILGLSSEKVPVGYDYNVWMAAVLTWGDGAHLGVLDIIFDGTKALSRQPVSYRVVTSYSGAVPLYGSTSTVQGSFFPLSTVDADVLYKGTANYTFFLPVLYGGKEKEGGVQGDITFYFGSGYQLRDEDWATKSLTLETGLDGVMPRYSDLCYVVFKGTNFGMSPQLKQWEFVLHRHVSTPGSTGRIAWAGDTEAIGFDAWGYGDDHNPIGIIWDALTNRRYGAGIDEAMLDQPAFAAAAATLASAASEENRFGMSLYKGDQQSVQDIIDEVCRTADIVLDRSPLTGLLRPKLIRNDYVKASLPHYEVGAGLLRLEGTRREWQETINDVTVNFTNARRTFIGDSVNVKNHANIGMTGGIRSQTLDFRGITNEGLAMRVARRALHAGSLPLWRGRIWLDRSAYGLMKGDVCRISYPRHGIVDMVVRVIAVDTGRLDQGQIEVDVSEDVFAYAASYNGTVAQPLPPPATAPNPTAFFEPEIEPVVTQTADTGTVALRINDPSELVTLVEWKVHVRTTTEGPWTADDGTFTKSAPITPYAETVIFWRVTFMLPEGIPSTIEGAVTFLPQPAVPPPSLDYTIDDAGNYVVTATVAPSATSVRMLGTVDSRPTDAAVIATAPDTVAPYELTGTLAADEILYVGAAAQAGDVVSVVARIAVSRSGGATSIGGAPLDIAALQVGDMLRAEAGVDPGSVVIRRLPRPADWATYRDQYLLGFDLSGLPYWRRTTSTIVDPLALTADTTAFTADSTAITADQTEG